MARVQNRIQRSTDGQASADLIRWEQVHVVKERLRSNLGIQHTQWTTLLDQPQPSPYILLVVEGVVVAVVVCEVVSEDGAYYLKDRGTGPNVWQ